MTRSQRFPKAEEPSKLLDDLDGSSIVRMKLLVPNTVKKS